MIKRILFILALLVSYPQLRADQTAPRYFAASPGALAKVKARLAAQDPSLQPALKALVHAAEKAMQITPPSVMQKDKTPPSGDRHDYMSLAPYYWPDPKKPNGLPYIRHDGVINPESREDGFDHGRMAEMADSVETLAQAYFFTGRMAYAEHAAQCLRVWFLDPATRMNPNLDFAQAVAGENTGRGTGILEGRHISQAADAAELLAGSPAWTPQDQAEFKVWLSTYLNWLLTSKNGRAEAAAKNNHGTWYDVQALELALVLDKNEVVQRIAGAACKKRLAAQIEPDGKQPLELERTAAFGYSQFNLEALFTLATMSEYAGVDLWHCHLANGKEALATALDYLLPYIADPSKKWPYDQIKKFKRSVFAPQLRQAALVYHEPRYEKALAGFPDSDQGRFQLLYPHDTHFQPHVDIGTIDHERILKSADAALGLAPVSITTFHAQHSNGGPNDFYSNADYWWPDPAKTNGLPYIQHDGETNPNNFNEHRIVLRQLSDAVAALGAAYKITGDDRYAQKAAVLLQVFFLDVATRMNPSLEHAQAIPGRDNGRGFGIIDGLHLIEVPQAITALEHSGAFTPELVAGLQRWFGDLAGWMVTSKNGREEASTKNNHAVAFWLQVACYARFTGDAVKLGECRRQFKEVFVPNQMAVDGSFPLELKRTKPYAYSIFQLDNMTTLCQVLSTPADSLWDFALPDGRGIRKAVAYLYPYLADKSKWPLKPDVMAWEGWPARQPDLLFAGLALGESQYLELWKKLPSDPVNAEVRRNIAITQPILWVNEAGSAPNVAAGR